MDSSSSSKRPKTPPPPPPARRKRPATAKGKERAHSSDEHPSSGYQSAQGEAGLLFSRDSSGFRADTPEHEPPEGFQTLSVSGISPAAQPNLAIDIVEKIYHEFCKLPSLRSSMAASLLKVVKKDLRGPENLKLLNCDWICRIFKSTKGGALGLTKTRLLEIAGESGVSDLSGSENKLEIAKKILTTNIIYCSNPDNYAGVNPRCTTALAKRTLEVSDNEVSIKRIKAMKRADIEGNRRFGFLTKF